MSDNKLLKQLSTNDINAFHLMLIHFDKHNSIKNRYEQCKLKLSEVSSFIRRSEKDINMRIICTGLFVSQFCVCYNPNRLSKLIGYCKTFLNNYFGSIGYSVNRKCTVSFFENNIPELVKDKLSVKQWKLKYHTGEEQNKDALLNDLRSNIVKILNIGSISKQKAEEIINLIQNPCYSNIPTSLIAKMPLLAPSFFYRHRKPESSLCDKRKGHSGRKHILSYSE